MSSALTPVVGVLGGQHPVGIHSPGAGGTIRGGRRVPGRRVRRPQSRLPTRVRREGRMVRAVRHGDNCRLLREVSPFSRLFGVKIWRVFTEISWVLVLCAVRPKRW